MTDRYAENIEVPRPVPSEAERAKFQTMADASAKHVASQCGAVLTFDEATHTYARDGKILPSVTQILKATGMIDATYYTDETRQRGEIVALGTELDDRGGTLDEDSPTIQEHMGYIRAWRAFRAQFGGEIVAIEKPVHHRFLEYAGTPDREMHNRGTNVVGEIKTGSAAKWHRLQTAAYADTYIIRPQRIAVYLSRSGTYRAMPHTDESDYDVWRGLVARFNWERT